MCSTANDMPKPTPMLRRFHGHAMGTCFSLLKCLEATKQLELAHAEPPFCDVAVTSCPVHRSRMGPNPAEFPRSGAIAILLQYGEKGQNAQSSTCLLDWAR